MISVIIPAYNCAETLRNTVMSIIKQTYKSIEIIIVNDGSKDATQEVIDLLISQFPEQIRGIETENRGVSSARLTGVSAAKGEWIGFTDSDDLLEEDMYEILFENAQKYNADISHCGYQMISETGEVKKFYGTEIIKIQDNVQGLTDLLNGDFVEPSLCNKLFHVSLFEKLKQGTLMDLRITCNEDLLMNYYLFRESQKSVFYDVCKYNYIKRNKEKEDLRKDDHKIYDPIRVRIAILSDIRSEAVVTARKVLLRTCIYVYNGLINNKQLYDSDLKRVRMCIKAAQADILLLSDKIKICAYMIIYCPHLYSGLYRFYEKYLLKSKYL